MIKYLEIENDFNVEINEKTILVDFYADWCGPCKMMGEVIKNLNGIDVLKVDVMKFPNVAQIYNIDSIPTLILFKDGKPVKQNIGFLNAQELNEFIKY